MTGNFHSPEDGAWNYESVIAAEKANYPLKFLFFWSHSPPPSGNIGPHVLSQWYTHAFEHDGVRYPTAEHFMMAEKARLFGDHDRLTAILEAASPRQAKALGRRVRGFDEAMWEANRFDIVTRVSSAKFSSDDQLRSYLVETGASVLVEASPLDSVWGIGMDRSNPAASHPSCWRGLNLLGFALTHARARLRRSSDPIDRADAYG